MVNCKSLALAGWLVGVLAGCGGGSGESAASIEAVALTNPVVVNEPFRIRVAVMRGDQTDVTYRGVLSITSIAEEEERVLAEHTFSAEDAGLHETEEIVLTSPGQYDLRVNVDGIGFRDLYVQVDPHFDAREPVPPALDVPPSGPPSSGPTKLVRIEPVILEHTVLQAALEDFDGDGDLDLLTLGLDDESNMILMLNDGTGSFTEADSITDEKIVNITAGDVDGDGDIDFLANRFPDYKTHIWLNDGDGAFSRGEQVIGTTRQPMRMADVDGDGDLDLLRISATAVALWRNDGDGVFSDEGNAMEAAGITDMIMTDLDSDGDLDALLGRMRRTNVVFLNDGDGGFTESQAFTDATATLVVAAGDVDGDGDMDLLSGNYQQNNNLWLNDGSGNFTDSGQELGSSCTEAVAMLDVDGDGDLDIINGANSDNADIGFNDGLAEFTLQPSETVMQFTSLLITGDIDGDGDVDLLRSQVPGHGNGYLELLKVARADEE